MKSHPTKVGAKTRITLSSAFKIPKLLTYNKLIEELKEIDIGNVCEIDNTYVTGLEVDGYIYRWIYQAERQRVLIFAYVGLRLKDAVSLFNRFVTSEEQLTQLDHPNSF